jgi:hypothetical protein
VKARWLILWGLILGLAGGLVFAWVIAPPEYYNIYPPLMAPEHRRDWIQMTALAYGVEGKGGERTQLRLRGLAAEEIRQVTAQTLETAAAEGRPIEVLRRLAKLAQFYGADTPAVRIYAEAEAPVTPTSIAPTATSTPIPPTSTPTRTPLPATPTPTTTPSPLPAPYRVLTQTITCTTQARISVALYLSPTVEGMEDDGDPPDQPEPLPGEDIWLLWDEAADRAVTGMRPALGRGYADFEVTPGQTYKVYVGSATGAPLVTLPVGPCPLDRETGWTSYHLHVIRLGSASASPTPEPDDEGD